MTLMTPNILGRDNENFTGFGRKIIGIVFQRLPLMGRPLGEPIFLRKLDANQIIHARIGPPEFEGG